MRMAEVGDLCMLNHDGMCTEDLMTHNVIAYS